MNSTNFKQISLSTEQNPVVFANKRTNLLELEYPVAKMLHDLMKDNNVYCDEIKQSHLEMLRLFKLLSDECEGKVVYFKLDLETIRYHAVNSKGKLEINKLEIKHIIAAMVKGYTVGITNNSKQREKAHKSSSSKLLTITIECNQHSKMNQLIEYLIIKLINFRNCDVNNMNGHSCYLVGLSVQQHLMVGLYYVKYIFEKVKQSIETEPSTFIYNDIVVQTENIASSQETTNTVSSDINLSFSNFINKRPLDVSLKYTEINKLKTGQVINIYGRCHKILGSCFSKKNGNMFRIQLKDNFDSISEVHFFEDAYYLSKHISTDDWLELKAASVEKYRVHGVMKKRVIVTDPTNFSKINVRFFEFYSNLN